MTESTAEKPKVAPGAHGEHGNGHPDGDEAAVIPQDLPKVSARGVIIAAIVAVICFAGLFAIGWFPRQHRLATLDEDLAAQSQTAIVEVAQPTRKSKPFDLWLPADVRSMQETSIYPRANGYLKRLLVDIGDQVKEGQLLAEIDTPEVDADLRQAEANLGLSQANFKKAQEDAALAQTTLTRYEKAPPGGVTQQDLDEKRAALQQAKASLEANQASIRAMQATVERLKAQQGYKNVFAPFAGTITARNFDVGALLMPTTTPGAKELFRIDETDLLRVFVNVPQTYVNSIKIGQQVALSVRNYSGREFTGTVTRTAGALDPMARTLRYEIDVPNKDGSLYSGMYGQARLPVTPQTPPIMVPTSALVFDSAGIRVWTLEPGNVVRARKVEVGRDYGTEVEISSGLNGDESVVTNPGTRLSDGSTVTVARAPALPEHAEAGAAQVK